MRASKIYSSFLKICILTTFMLLVWRLNVALHGRERNLARLHYHFEEHNEVLNKTSFLHIYTYTDRLQKEECASFQTALIKNLNLNVLVGRQSNEGTDAKKLRKIPVTLDAFDHIHIPSNHIIMFCDASDVVYTESANKIIDAFEKVEKQYKKNKNLPVVIFGAERNCWPFMHNDIELIKNGRLWCEKIYPSSNTSFRWLNSGQFITRVGVMKNLLNDAFALLESGIGDDQLAYQWMFLSQYATKNRLKGEHLSLPVSKKGLDIGVKYSIVLDTSCEIFQTGYMTNIGDSSDGGLNMKDVYFNITEGKLQNLETNTSPAVVHFNGGKKNFLRVAYAALESNLKRSEQGEKELNWFRSCKNVLN